MPFRLTAPRARNAVAGGASTPSQDVKPRHAGVTCAGLIAAVLLLPAVAWADPPAALVPRTPTGFSNVRQRYVYAPPDEGEFTFPLHLGNGAPREYLIEEPSMCRGSAQAKVHYSKSSNVVQVTADFHGLPYRMSATRPDDMSTPYNRYPVSVQNGKWQLWFVGRQFDLLTKFYYDARTLQLIGNEMDVKNPPADAVVIPINTLHMVSGPLFEGSPAGEGHFVFEFKYDQMLDALGSGGVYYAYVPYNLCQPDAYGPYYTQGGLPASKALNFDQVLQNIHGGYSIAVAFSLEPDPKPAYLDARDNPMIGWSGSYPLQMPDGVFIDPVEGTLRLHDTCGTHVNRPYAKPYYNLCTGK